ncbi:MULTISPECIES: alkene reductase [Pseudomonas]|uniref:alkene reductase n=1 Tax=Pseudomonas TaxID=286 RepID=UPI00049B0AF4|nr:MULTISPECIES: alkene reductase [Pseudomonas]AHZ78058.1 NADH:flavin oxidoreductase [Pseudomonas putida]MBP2839345.1 alkene reductase [Pseudomonas sp. PNP]MCK2122744.1 alkene reductase [Pseudomonas sp. PNPG3]QUN65204.1 alkene reductase [Pseudomonas sp. JS425]
MVDLFETFNLKGLSLENRIVMAPLTRSRARSEVANEQLALYYTQRATAGLIISEGTPVSRAGHGYLYNPGIYTPEQIEGWKLVTDSVHSVGGKMFAQIWHVGRISHTSLQVDNQPPVSSTSRVAKGATVYAYAESGETGFVDTSAPRALKTEEVAHIVEQFAQAAENAMAAGFDGVEIHGANGYLFEQFMNPLVNDRTDRYSARNLEDRLRFAFEVVDAVSARIGADKVGYRISPYGQLYDMPVYPQIDETYTALCAGLSQRGLAYVHVMDQSHFFLNGGEGAEQEQSLRNLLKRCKAVLGNTALILAGDMTIERARALTEAGLIDLAAFGQPYIGNPDLVARLKHGWPLTVPDRDTFYIGTARGYIDYPPYSAS